MAVDYSHIKQAVIAGFARALEDGWEPFDEDLLETVESITPSLLAGDAMAALRAQLDHRFRRLRGRPKKGSIGRADLARMLADTNREGPISVIADYVRKRLETRQTRSKLDWLLAFRRFQQIHDRDGFFRTLYRDFYDWLGGPPPYRHHILGEVDFGSLPQSSRHVQALIATKHVLAERLEIICPSRAAMANILSTDPERRVRRVPPRPYALVRRSEGNFP